MSASGQTAKYSNGAQFFRVSSDSRHLPDSWDGPAPAYPGDRDIRKLPPVSAALNRRRSRILGFWRAPGSSIIARPRSNSAHLHRPWRAPFPWHSSALPRRPQLFVAAWRLSREQRRPRLSDGPKRF
jgi:hypothetical protein